MGISVKERKIWSQIRKWIRTGGVIHGGLVDMARECGKSNCRCSGGEKHASLYLALSYKGKKRMLYIPQDWEGRVKEWVRRYKDIRQILEELSEMHWEKIRHRKE